MRLENCAAEHRLRAWRLPSPWRGSLQEGFSWEVKAHTRYRARPQGGRGRRPLPLSLHRRILMICLCAAHLLPPRWNAKPLGAGAAWY